MMSEWEYCPGWSRLDSALWDAQVTATVDGRLDDIWRWKKWQAANQDVQLLPWPMRSPAANEVHREQSNKVPSPIWQAGWFSPSYPVLSPYYPLPTTDTQFVDPWSVQDYHGAWW